MLELRAGHAGSGAAGAARRWPWWRTTADKRGVRIEQRLDRRARAVMGDATRVKQILTNLLSNAVKYNVDGGSVTCAAGWPRRQVVEIEVNDTGLGMTRGAAGRAVPALQPAGPRGRGGRRHRHRPGDQPPPGRADGRHAARAAASPARARPSRSTPAARARCRAPTLPQRRRAADALPRHYRQRAGALRRRQRDQRRGHARHPGCAGHRSSWRVSTQGLDGLAAIRQRRPSLILLDMHLPDIDGLELLRHLKDDDDLGDIPVIVVSADATAARIDAGADGRRHPLRDQAGQHGAASWPRRRNAGRTGHALWLSLRTHSK